MIGKINRKIKLVVFVLLTVSVCIFVALFFVNKTSSASDEVKQEPHISLPNNLHIDFGNEQELKDSIQAKDYTGKKITNEHIKITGFNSHKIGRQIIIISARDSAGRTEKMKSAISVVDSTKPVLKNVKDISVQQKSTEKFAVMSGITANDNVDGDITSRIKVTGEVNMNKPGTYNITYTVTDNQRNSQIVKRVITVVAEKSENIKESQVTSTRENADNTETTSSSESTGSGQVTDSASEPMESVTSTFKEEPVTRKKKSIVEIGNDTIPFVDSTRATEAPSTGCGTWVGTGDVDDGGPTYFIGHNPGDFTDVLNLQNGSTITVYDRNGNSKVYSVVEVLDVDDYGNNLSDSSDNMTDRALYSTEEQIALQTCITDNTNRVVIAK